MNIYKTTCGFEDRYFIKAEDIILYVGLAVGVYRWMGPAPNDICQDKEEIAPLTFLLLTGYSVEHILQEGRKIKPGSIIGWSSI